MAYDNGPLNRIFDRTDERCHLCAGPLLFSRYGDVLHSRGWEVDHDRPRARGGSHRERNLLPAHVRCNRSKRATRSARIRARNGLAARPMSVDERRAARLDNAVVAGVSLALVAGLVGALATKPGGDPLLRAAGWATVGGLAGMSAGPPALVIDPEGAP